MTFQGRLVKNRDLTIQRVQQRLDDIDIQIKQKSQEASEGLRLLAVIDRPNTLIAGRLNNDKGPPVIDVGVLDKLLKNDYIGPVVTKISKLQSETQELEAEKGRLQKRLTFLPKAVNVDIKELPRGYKEAVDVLSSELTGIVRSYNRLLDDYLTAAVTGLVAVRQAPIARREGSSPRDRIIKIPRIDSKVDQKRLRIGAPLFEEPIGFSFSRGFVAGFLCIRHLAVF